MYIRVLTKLKILSKVKCLPSISLGIVTPLKALQNVKSGEELSTST
jgi:hypothetical protein